MKTKRSITRSPKRAQAGFSLIEIILVVVLIGGIVAFAATRILGGGDRAKVNLAKAQVQTLAEKVQQFDMDTGSLPGSLDELVTAAGKCRRLARAVREGRRAQGSLEPSVRVHRARRWPGVRPGQPGQGWKARRHQRRRGHQVPVSDEAARLPSCAAGARLHVAGNHPGDRDHCRRERACGHGDGWRLQEHATQGQRAARSRPTALHACAGDRDR